MPPQTHPSSRESAGGAGWGCAEPGTFRDLMPKRPPRFSWLMPSVLWRSRNDIVARWFGDPVDGVRRRWVAQQLAGGADPDFTISRDTDAFSFLVAGDTGEGEAPQYAVVPGLLKVGEGTDFMIIASDVIYPVGSVDDYPEKFFQPYQDYAGPIYAVPGNHDWYDTNFGFMRVFCGAAKPLEAGAGSGSPWRGILGPLARLLWRRPGKPDETALAAAERLRSQPEQRAAQPGPYWAIDTPSLRIIGIDTGIQGELDQDQGAWLRRVSSGPKPKLLVTGKPLYVDDAHHPGAIDGGGTVDDIVTDPACNYVAAIGGDIHNYQRYPMDIGGRRIEYVVSGGGGAFMHATHTIPKTTVLPEDHFKCYPLRGDSLAFYSRVYARRLRARWLFELSPEQAAAVVAHRLGITPQRGPAGRPSPRARLVAFLLGVPGKGPGRRSTRWLRLPVRKAYTRVFSSSSASNTPPFFKSFLRLDVSPTELRIRCYAATGCHEHEVDPPLEDEILIRLDPLAP
jgi:hypothetical protein